MMSNDSRLFKIIDLYTNESFHEPFNLAGMLLRFLVVVDAHEKDVIGAESIIAFIDVCTHLFSQISRLVNCDKKVVVKISTAERMCRSGE